MGHQGRGLGRVRGQAASETTANTKSSAADLRLSMTWKECIMTYDRLATREWKVRSDISASRSMTRLPSPNKSRSDLPRRGRPIVEWSGHLRRQVSKEPQK